MKPTLPLLTILAVWGGSMGAAAQGIGARGAVEVQVEAEDEPPPPAEETPAEDPPPDAPEAPGAATEGAATDSVADGASPTPTEASPASRAQPAPEVQPPPTEGAAAEPAAPAAPTDPLPLDRRPPSSAAAEPASRPAASPDEPPATRLSEPPSSSPATSSPPASSPTAVERPPAGPIVIPIPTPGDDPLLGELQALLGVFGADRSLSVFVGLLLWLVLALLAAMGLRSLRERLPQEGLIPRALALLHLAVRLVALGLALAFVVRMLPPRLSLVMLLAFGGFAVALGWSMRDVLPDLVAGFVLAFERRIRRGAWISAADFSGLVESVGLRTTELRDGQGRIVSVPNRHILRSPVAAGGSHEREYEVALRLDAPEVPAENVRAALRDAVLASPWVFPGAAAVVLRDPEDASMWRVRARLLDATFGARFEGELLERAEAHLELRCPVDPIVTAETNP